MNYQDWLRAVDQALRQAGSTYGAAQIDPAHKQDAFNHGISPVIYAKQAPHPLRGQGAQQPHQPASVGGMNLPPFDFKRALYVAKFLDVCGFILQIVGATIILFWGVALMIGGFTAGSTGQSAAQGASNAFSSLFWGAALTLMIPMCGVAMIFHGVICWWLTGVFRSVYRN